MFKLLAPIGFLMEHAYRTPFHGDHCLICRIRNQQVEQNFSNLQYIHPESSYLDANKQNIAQRTCFFMQVLQRSLKAPLMQKYNFNEVKSMSSLLETPCKCHLLLGETQLATLQPYESLNATCEHSIWIVSKEPIRLGFRYGPGYFMEMNLPSITFKSTVIIIHLNNYETFIEHLIRPGHRSLQDILLAFPEAICESNRMIDPAMVFFGFEVEFIT